MPFNICISLTFFLLSVVDFFVCLLYSIKNYLYILINLFGFIKRIFFNKNYENMVDSISLTL